MSGPTTALSILPFTLYLSFLIAQFYLVLGVIALFYWSNSSFTREIKLLTDGNYQFTGGFTKTIITDFKTIEDFSAWKIKKTARYFPQLSAIIYIPASLHCDSITLFENTLLFLTFAVILHPPTPPTWHKLYQCINTITTLPDCWEI